jgi:hypothetical protein
VTRIDYIIAYENSELSDEQTLELFSDLIRSGDAWTLQGHYGRAATALIEEGLISKTGELLRGKDGKQPRQRCGKCEACKRVEAAKPMHTPEPYARRPYHADDLLVRSWNATLEQNPCEEWQT